MVVEDIVLAIGAYKSVFCTNIVASCIFEMMEISFLQAKHRGIYRDGNYLQFTTEVWSSTEPSTNKTSNNNNNERQTCSPMEKWMKRVKLCMKNAFPFGGMKMMWADQGFLCFGVYHKEGQAI
eukprot:2074905-Ditylum_brightwellii.AAC.1